MTLLGPAEVRELALRLGIRPTKQLGQNFVHDPNTVRRIVRAAELDPGDVVVEVGPGLGSLTLALLPAAAAVYAVEIDPTLAAALPATAARHQPEYADRLHTITRDALTVTADDFPVPPTALVANLPYNVAVPVVLHLLATLPSLRHGLVMVQKEVADRLTAAPGSKTYGIPSVKLAWYAHSRPAGRVSPAVFWPVPNVDSGLVAFTRRDPPAPAAGVPSPSPGAPSPGAPGSSGVPDPSPGAPSPGAPGSSGAPDPSPGAPSPSAPGVDRAAVFAVVDAAFAQRRKTLRAALAGWAGGADTAERLLRTAGIDPGTRGETLPVERFADIAAVAAGTFSGAG